MAQVFLQWIIYAKFQHPCNHCGYYGGIYQWRRIARSRVYRWRRTQGGKSSWTGLAQVIVILIQLFQNWIQPVGLNHTPFAPSTISSYYSMLLPMLPSCLFINIWFVLHLPSFFLFSIFLCFILNLFLLAICWISYTNDDQLTFIK